MAIVTMVTVLLSVPSCVTVLSDGVYIAEVT